MGKKLSNREQRFADEYLIDLNAERAALAAGYAKSVARGKAYHWVCKGTQYFKPHVYEAIEARQTVIHEKLELTQEMVRAELAKLGFAKITDVVSWNGDKISIKDSAELDDNAIAGIKTIKATTRKLGNDGEIITVEIVQHDKKAALDSLAKHLGMFKEQKEIAVVKETAEEAEARKQYEEEKATKYLRQYQQRQRDMEAQKTN